LPRAERVSPATGELPFTSAVRHRKDLFLSGQHAVAGDARNEVPATQEDAGQVVVGAKSNRPLPARRCQEKMDLIARNFRSRFLPAEKAPKQVPLVRPNTLGLTELLDIGHARALEQDEGMGSISFARPSPSLEQMTRAGLHPAPGGGGRAVPAGRRAWSPLAQASRTLRRLRQKRRMQRCYEFRARAFRGRAWTIDACGLARRVADDAFTGGAHRQGGGAGFLVKRCLSRRHRLGRKRCKPIQNAPGKRSKAKRWPGVLDANDLPTARAGSTQVRTLGRPAGSTSSGQISGKVGREGTAERQRGRMLFEAAP